MASTETKQMWNVVETLERDDGSIYSRVVYTTDDLEDARAERWHQIAQWSNQAVAQQRVRVVSA